MKMATDTGARFFQHTVWALADGLARCMAAIRDGNSTLPFQYLYDAARQNNTRIRLGQQYDIHELMTGILGAFQDARPGAIDGTVTIV